MIHYGHIIVAKLPASDRIEVASLDYTCEGVSRGHHGIDWLNVVVQEIEAVGNIGDLG